MKMLQYTTTDGDNTAQAAVDISEILRMNEWFNGERTVIALRGGDILPATESVDELMKRMETAVEL